MQAQFERIKHSSDFEALDYLESERSEQEFFIDLETLLREYLQKPSVYHAYVDAQGILTDRNGLSLVEMGDRADEKHKGTPRYERVHGETDGLRVLEELYRVSEDNDIVLLAMPPGLRKEGFGDTSMTNISVIHTHDGVKEISTYTVPSLFLSADDHRKKLEKAAVGTIPETRHINYSTRPDIILSSHPIRIPQGKRVGTLDVISAELGYENFDALKLEVDRALRVEDDPRADSRRYGLMSFIAKQIVSFRAKRNREGLIALGRTVRAVFALEAADGFRDVETYEMIRQFKEYMSAFVRKQQLDKVSDPRINMAVYAQDPGLVFLWELQRKLHMNPAAQARLEASMCGGGGFDYMANDWQNLFTTRFGGDMADLRNPSTLQDILSKSESKEKKYSFDQDGTCVVCKKESKEVGKLGPCHICKGCDDKIQSQVD